MTQIRQDAVGRCEFIDVLEEAVTLRKRVEVELRSGEVFTDEVKDVITRDGQEFVRFVERGELPLSEVLGCRNARPTHH